MKKKNILVLGSGVSGLTTALKLLQAGHSVTIWSREEASRFPSTSLNAYAMWVPVKDEAQPRLKPWANTSLAEFQRLAAIDGTGVALRPIFVLKTEKQEPWFADEIDFFRHATADELSSQYADANVLDGAPVIDPEVYLPWLHAQVVAAGASFEIRQVESFDDCPNRFEVVINCTSLGARKLASDNDLYPTRIQIVKIKNNGFDRVVIDDEGPNKLACICPQTDYIKLGAIFDEGDESLEVDEALTLDILARCNKMAPGLDARQADIISVSRALRPERRLVRVEQEQLPDGRTVVHNYGHDGMGYIISWGIAAEITGYLNA